MAIATPVRIVGGHELPAVGTWTIDPAHSQVTVEVRHMMISKQRGSFEELSGTIVVADKLEDSSVEVMLKTASFKTDTPDRDKHVRSADFLGVEQFPEAVFKSASLTQRSSDRWTVAGTLALKGITKPVTLEVKFEGGLIDPWGKPRIAFSATAEIDREEWGVSWNMPLAAGGIMVGKVVTLMIDAQATLG